MLTGTPLENRLDDLLSVLDFVAPGRFDPGSYALGLQRLLGEVQLRRWRSEVLNDLPPKLSVPVLSDLPRPAMPVLDGSSAPPPAAQGVARSE